MDQASDPIEVIWSGDLLGRRTEADLIQLYVEAESAEFLAQVGIRPLFWLWTLPMGKARLGFWRD